MPVQNRPRRTFAIGLLLLCAAAAHAVFAWHHRDLRPDLVVLETPPTAVQRTLFAFGDTQFLYRYWSSYLQNAGDTGGRATRMRNYDYDDVIGWLKTLQALDSKAQQHTFLAAHYFSQTPRMDDLRKVLAFIADDVAKHPARKWYWLTYAMPAAAKTLDDIGYALELSRQLASYDFPHMTGWNYLFPAIYLERMGRFDEARAEIAGVLETRRSKLDSGQLMWIEEFTRGLAAPRQ